MDTDPKGFFDRSAVKAAMATTAFVWLPIVTGFVLLRTPATGDVEYAIRSTLETWLAAFGIVKWGSPSAPMP